MRFKTHLSITYPLFLLLGANHFAEINLYTVRDLPKMANKVIEVSHVTTRGTSIRITLPRKIVKLLGVGVDDIVVFKEYKDGSVILEKLNGD